MADAEGDGSSASDHAAADGAAPIATATEAVVEEAESGATPGEGLSPSAEVAAPEAADQEIPTTSTTQDQHQTALERTAVIVDKPVEVDPSAAPEKCDIILTQEPCAAPAEHKEESGSHPVEASASNRNSQLRIDTKAETEKAAKPKSDKPGAVKKEIGMVEHMLNFEELKAKLSTTFNPDKPMESGGLTQAEAEKRLAENGPNSLTPPKKRHPFLKFLDILCNLFNVMLIAAGIASYILVAINYAANFQNTYLGGILIGVAFMNAVIEHLQAQKSQAILESFLNMIPAQCYIIREGKQQQVAAKDLVIGDVVYVNMGSKVPADLYVFAATDLKVDNSSLTGEAEPQERSKKNTHENPLETANLMFNGTLAVNGEGYGVVVRTGDHTVIGQIASLTAGEDRRESPLSAEIDNFVKLIAAVAGIFALVFFIVAIVNKGTTISNALNFAIGTFVSFVPEGLPATVT
ncbi:hypothetical protein HK405_007066, partial [Cladochytrium tenue]